MAYVSRPNETIELYYNNKTVSPSLDQFAAEVTKRKVKPIPLFSICKESRAMAIHHNLVEFLGELPHENSRNLDCLKAVKQLAVLDLHAVSLYFLRTYHNTPLSTAPNISPISKTVFYVFIKTRMMTAIL